MMRKIFWLIGLASCLLSCGKRKTVNTSPEEPARPKIMVRVMTYNIYGARASSGPPANLEALAKVINQEKPDLVALQEVDVYTRRTGVNVHQAAELAKLTGMDWYFTKAMDVTGGEYGDAVLSRLPILERKRYALPVAPDIGGEFRTMAMIRVKKDGREFYFASTHLDHLAQEDSRLLQAAELKKAVTELGKPLILGGDFNAIPASQTIGIMRSFMNLGCLQQCPLTFPSDKPDRTIDYIMTTPVNRFSVTRYNNISGYDEVLKVYVSDHRAIVADISVQE
ncbi:endonuclease/exonuclease/phosphatase family metal-dependent hydrolase [Chitinophaga sp. W3I9]